MRYIVLTKPLGKTPLQAIEAWRKEHPQYAELPASYAGRLDPMAEGSLLVLLGDECKRQEKYRGLDKEYEIEVLLDLSTDTGDVLGIPAYTTTETHPGTQALRGLLQSEVGTKNVPYPAFSSKTVNGKPLFLYALEGTLNSIEIPIHEETIRAITLLGIEQVTAQTLKERVLYMLSKAPRSTDPSKTLGADFRQDAIREEWQTLFKNMKNRDFAVLTLRVTCGSGTYMRTLAERIGKGLGTSALALSIRRTRIGKVRAFLGINLWTKSY